MQAFLILLMVLIDLFESKSPFTSEEILMIGMLRKIGGGHQSTILNNHTKII